MEKKTKKLQLRKETIAVLNGQCMSHVVGGNGGGCQMDGEFYNDGEVVINDGNQCVCVNGNWQCRPEDAITLWSTDICPYSMKGTCVQVCNTIEKTCNSCGPITNCNCA